MVTGASAAPKGIPYVSTAPAGGVAAVPVVSRLACTVTATATMRAITPSTMAPTTTVRRRRSLVSCSRRTAAARCAALCALARCVAEDCFFDIRLLSRGGSFAAGHDCPTPTGCEDANPTRQKGRGDLGPEPAPVSYTH